MSAPTWALTVPQPAAWAIAHGHQDVYNRAMATKQRGWMAICAGADLDHKLLGQTSRLTGWTLQSIIAACPERYMVVAVARLVDVCEGGPCDCGPWADKQLIHWRFADAVPLAEPVPAPRTLGLWQMSDELAERVATQWRRTGDTTPEAEPAASQTRRDFLSLRDELLPLPGSAEGYRHVLLLGTTGAGKTTVVRQLLGTDPKTERFPSTSTAKTTVADTELILTGERRFRAAVTFADRDEIADHLRDNVWEAAKAVFEGRSDEAVHKLLDHVSQRYRFSYLLGRPMSPRTADDLGDDLDDLDDDDLDDLDDEEIGGGSQASALGASDPATAAMLHEAVRAIHHVVGTRLVELQNEITADGDDRTVEEIIEDELENRIRRSQVCSRIVEAMLDAIEDRFDLLTEGELHRDADGWPVSWSWSSEDRAEFIRVITRFSSNQNESFGTLLTPLVNGIRVAGPFRPLWAESDARLVLMDGEGMGHINASATEVSTRLRKRLDEVDAVILVDNATQPMQAAPVSVMRTAATTGNADKLFFLFTHFDLVRGDNMRTVSERRRHVRDSAENVLNAVREDLGVAERVLRRRLDDACYFVGGINDRLDPQRLDPAKRKASQRTIQQFNKLVEDLTAESIEVEVGPARPVYKSEQITQTVVETAQVFHKLWRGMLGLSYDPEVQKKHWASIKALTRRLSEGREDEYKDLRPAASLRTYLENGIYRMLQNPVRWTGPEPDAEERQVIIDTISNAVTKRLVRLVDMLITEEARTDWLRAYEEYGKGSTFRRAQILAEDIYARAVPYPGHGDAYDNPFVQEVRTAFAEVAAELDFLLD